MRLLRRKREAALSLTVLALLAAWIAGFTWTQLRQERRNRALFAAIRKDDEPAVVALLNAGADPNARDDKSGPTTVWSLYRDLLNRLQNRGNKPGKDNRSTPLTAALELRPFPGAPGVSSVPSENVVIIRSLLQKGADPNVPDTDGETPLMLASEDGHADTVQLLLKYGAKVNVVCMGSNGTALSKAIWMGNDRIVKMLLNAGADVNLKDSYGVSPLRMAETIESDELPTIFRSLLDAGADVNARTTYSGQTPLMDAAARANPKLIRFLITRGADANATDKTGDTALMIALKSAYCNRETIRALLAGHPNVNVKDMEGFTALYLARLYGHPYVAALLKQAGAKE